MDFLMPQARKNVAQRPYYKASSGKDELFDKTGKGETSTSIAKALTSDWAAEERGGDSEPRTWPLGEPHPRATCQLYGGSALLMGYIFLSY